MGPGVGRAVGQAGGGGGQRRAAAAMLSKETSAKQKLITQKHLDRSAWICFQLCCDLSTQAWPPYTQMGPIGQEQSANRSGNTTSQVPKLLTNRPNRAKLPFGSIARSHQSVPGTGIYLISGTRHMVPGTRQI